MASAPPITPDEWNRQYDAWRATIAQRRVEWDAKNHLSAVATITAATLPLPPRPPTPERQATPPPDEDKMITECKRCDAWLFGNSHIRGDHCIYCEKLSEAEVTKRALAKKWEHDLKDENGLAVARMDRHLYGINPHTGRRGL